MVDMRRGITALIAILIITQLSTTIYFYSLLNERDSKISTLESQMANNPIASTKGNIVTGLGITELPPNPKFPYNSNGRIYSHLWITGWLFNSGGGIALNVSLTVLAYDISNKVLLNITFPISQSVVVVPRYSFPPYNSANIYSQQNVTVRTAVYHNDAFPESTQYEIIPNFSNR
jgi:hypothetical protein